MLTHSSLLVLVHTHVKNSTSCIIALLPFLGHLLRDDLINPVKLSVRPSIRTYVRPSVRPSVRMSTIKLNAATNQMVEFVRVDETFTTI